MNVISIIYIFNDEINDHYDSFWYNIILLFVKDVRFCHIKYDRNFYYYLFNHRYLAVII